METIVSTSNTEIQEPETPFCFYCGKLIKGDDKPVFSKGYNDENLTGQYYHPNCVTLQFGEAPLTREDTTPPIPEQAAAKGFKADYFNFGKLEGDGCDYFNPSFVQRPDGIWLLTRRSEPLPGFRFGQNHVWAFMMDEAGKIPKMGQRLRWPTENQLQHFEDPRGFYHDTINQTVVGACTFIWYPDGHWTGAHQCLGSFDEHWNCRRMNYPEIGGGIGKMDNIPVERYEKNWLWWLHEGKLHLLYKANPWIVFTFGEHWANRLAYKTESIHWKWGEIRGGTNPIRVGDYYFTFHHSSLPWKGRYRRYYCGAIAFEANHPFRARRITPEPILTGSQNDPWQQKKPLVVFPCGAIYRNNTWMISMGVNDMKAAWLEIQHDKLLSLMRPVGEVGETVFPVTGLDKNEQRKERLRLQLEKARLKKSQMITDGTYPRATRKKLRTKKRKRRKRVVRSHDADTRRGI